MAPSGPRRGRPRGPRREVRLLVAVAATLGLALGDAVVAGADLAEALGASVRSARSVAPELSVEVVALPSSEAVYSHRADEPRIIASNTKLITSAAALDRLGPGHLLETAVFIEGTQQGKILVGNLAIRGSGDPSISGRFFEGDPSAVFRGWARKLRSLGIEEISGDVVLVHGFFDDVRVHPDWPRDQLARSYEAPVAALSFSDNSVLVRVYPGSRVGLPARVELVAGVPIFELENHARTIGSSRQHWLAVDREPGTNLIKVNGMILRGISPIDVWVSVNDPVEYFGAALVHTFAQEGVEIRGATRRSESLPRGDWYRIAEHRTDLMTTLEVINRRSQNFYAESLLKHLGARFCRGGTWPAGIAVLEEFLAEAGIDDGYGLADGSGLSRGNRFTATQLTRLLAYMFEHRYAREFVLTLPYGGLEEHRTWRKRLAEPPYRERVFAKTGSLRGVSTLSGYVKAQSGQVYAFSILCNQVGSVWRARRAQDAIVKTLIDHG